MTGQHDSLRPTRAEVDLEAIAHNVRELRRLTRPGVQLMAVVKADGYGHGAVPVARAALAAGATWLGVAIAEEGAALRAAGIQAPILVLGWLPPDQADLAVRYDLRVACFDPAVARALDARARALGRRARVHIKIDTGMGRIGLRPDEVADAARAIAALPGVEVEGAFTHLATADEPDLSFAHEQLRRFEAGLAALAAAGVQPAVRHVANSAALMRLPASHYDLVRAGIALYGLPPSPDLPWPADLRPALRLVTRIAQVKVMRPGETVSYGRTWVAQGGERIATLPVGYADGFRRGLSGRGWVLVGGRRCPVAGRVCMDQTMVVVPPGVPAAPGDEAVLLGRQGDEEIPATEWARILGTIAYEVVTLIGNRVPRVYRP